MGLKKHDDTMICPELTFCDPLRIALKLGAIHLTRTHPNPPSPQLKFTLTFFYVVHVGFGIASHTARMKASDSQINCGFKNPEDFPIVKVPQPQLQKIVSGVQPLHAFSCHVYCLRGFLKLTIKSLSFSNPQPGTVLAFDLRLSATQENGSVPCTYRWDGFTR